MPRTVFYTLFALFFMAFSASAQTLEMQEAAAPISYIVENIEVDVTADNAVKAREKAFEEAQVKGYEMLAKRFLSEEEMASFTTPDMNTVSALVKDYEVTNEKLSATRYKGIYKIRYSKNAFAINNGSDSLSQTASAPQGDILVLPFYNAGGRTFLWQVNPFLEAWVRARNSGTAGRAIIPLGDIDDITQVRDNQALSYDPAKLNAMRLRYRAKDVALMIARPEAMDDGSTNIAVAFYNVRPYGPELSRQISVRGYSGEMQEQLYNRVVEEVLKVLWARGDNQATAQQQSPVTQVQQAPLTGSLTNIVAQLNFNSVREWVDVKRSIERAYGVQSVQVKSLSPRSAMIGINFQGDVGTLRQSLQSVGVGLRELPAQTGAPITYQLNAIRRY